MMLTLFCYKHRSDSNIQNPSRKLKYLKLNTCISRNSVKIFTASRVQQQRRPNLEKYSEVFFYIFWDEEEVSCGRIRERKVPFIHTNV